MELTLGQLTQGQDTLVMGKPAQLGGVGRCGASVLSTGQENLFQTHQVSPVLTTSRTLPGLSSTRFWVLAARLFFLQ